MELNKARAMLTAAPQIKDKFNLNFSLRMGNSIKLSFLCLGAPREQSSEELSCCSCGERESWPIACFLWGLLAGRSPRQLAHKEDERPAPTHSSLLAKKSNPFFAAGALRPAKKWSCLGVWVKESGMSLWALFASSSLSGSPAINYEWSE